MSKIEELAKQLEHPGGGQTVYRVMTINYNSEFEPYGRASEDWDAIWRVTLHLQRGAWKGTDGKWHLCNEGVPMTASGRTLDECAARLLDYMDGELAE